MFRGGLRNFCCISGLKYDLRVIFMKMPAILAILYLNMFLSSAASRDTTEANRCESDLTAEYPAT